MTYYAFIKNNQIKGSGQLPCLNNDIENVEITQEQFNNMDKYIYSDGEIIVDPDYDAKKLQKAKQNKLKETLDGAKLFIENEACYQFDENNSIEATDGNIGKLTAYALGFSTGAMQEVQWTSKEDNVITLDVDDLNRILIGIGAIQSFVWNVQYIQYKQMIETATTAEEVEAIEIVYTDIIPNEQQD